MADSSSGSAEAKTIASAIRTSSGAGRGSDGSNNRITFPAAVVRIMGHPL